MHEMAKILALWMLWSLAAPAFEDAKNMDDEATNNFRDDDFTFDTKVAEYVERELASK